MSERAAQAQGPPRNLPPKKAHENTEDSTTSSAKRPEIPRGSKPRMTNGDASRGPRAAPGSWWLLNALDVSSPLLAVHVILVALLFQQLKAHSHDVSEFWESGKNGDKFALQAAIYVFTLSVLFLRSCCFVFALFSRVGSSIGPNFSTVERYRWLGWWIYFFPVEGWWISTSFPSLFPAYFDKKTDS